MWLIHKACDRVMNWTTVCQIKLSGLAEPSNIEVDQSTLALALGTDAANFNPGGTVTKQEYCDQITKKV